MQSHLKTKPDPFSQQVCTLYQSLSSIVPRYRAHRETEWSVPRCIEEQSTENKQMEVTV